jgi:cytochrome P450
MTASLREEVDWFLTAGHERRQQVRRNPYPFYERLREHDPVYRHPGGTWLVTSYDACDALLRDPSWVKGSFLEGQERSDSAPGRLAERVFLGSLVFQDPPTHTRLRRIVSALFTPGAIERRRARTRQVARDLLRPLLEKEAFDFRGEFAAELPVRLICEFLGIPNDRRDDFLMWAETVRDLQELSGLDDDRLAGADAKARDCLDYFADLARAKRENPGDDLVSLLLAADSGDEQPLTHEEFTAMLLILHVGGHSTTTDVISTGMYHLLMNPAAVCALRDNPSLVPSAVEEIVRYDPPVTVATPRVTNTDIHLGGHLVPAGEAVYAVLAAANRDPARFDDAGVFNIERRRNRHLSFAAGAHFCLGAHLGRQEAQEAYALLFTRCPRLELAVDPQHLVWQDSLPHRGLVSLPVTWQRDGAVTRGQAAGASGRKHL